MHSLRDRRLLVRTGIDCRQNHDGRQQILSSLLLSEWNRLASRRTKKSIRALPDVRDRSRNPGDGLARTRSGSLGWGLALKTEKKHKKIAAVLTDEGGRSPITRAKNFEVSS